MPDNSLSYQQQLGERIRRRMYRLEITADYAAQEIGISPATMSRIITGTGETANWDTLKKLAKLLNWRIDHMMNNSQPNTYLCGIRQIDDDVAVFCHHLFRGEEGYKRLSGMVDPDYRLIYMDGPALSDKRIGPTLREEIIGNNAQNKPGQTVESHILSTSQLMESSILIHLRVKITREQHEVEILDKPLNLTVSDMIDVWELSTTLKEIKRGQPYLITKRYVQNIDRHTESY